MDIIALVTVGLLILIFIVIFWSRSRRNVSNILEGNKNVAPLFLEKSAGIKYNTIRANFNAKHPVSIKAQQLNADYAQQKISAEYYNNQLEKLIQENIKQ